jgi:hypothetical protein
MLSNFHSLVLVRVRKMIERFKFLRVNGVTG